MPEGTVKSRVYYALRALRLALEEMGWDDRDPDEHVRPLLGAYVLGQLGPDEATSVRAHLDGCAACREEAAALGSVADLLPLVDLERLEAPPEPPPPGLLDEVLSRIEEQQASGTHARRRASAIRGGIAAVAAVARARRGARPLVAGGGWAARSSR